MTTARSRCSLGLAAVLACGVLAAIALPAGAAPPVEGSHTHFVLTIPDDEVCGIPVTTTIDVITNDMVRVGRNGFPLFKSSGGGTVTFTNLENGQSIVNSFRGSSRDLSVTDNGDGTITVRTAVTGLPEVLGPSGGPATIRDAGRVVFATVIDFNGTPDTTDDDVFISQTVESVSGPHPELDSDFELFCEVIVAALT
jgi:hypothetical protein